MIEMYPTSVLARNGTAGQGCKHCQSPHHAWDRTKDSQRFRYFMAINQVHG